MESKATKRQKADNDDLVAGVLWALRYTNQNRSVVFYASLYLPCFKMCFVHLEKTVES